MKQPKMSKKKGAALLTSFMLLSLIAVAGTSYLSSSTEAVRTANRTLADGQTTNLAEAGIQVGLRSLWRPFKQDQSFTTFDANYTSATAENPVNALSGTFSGVGSYAVAIIKYVQPAGNSYARDITFRSVGWIDRNSNGVIDSGEPSKTVDVTSRYELSRSKIFDYAYFVNNYGWMDGFGVNDLVVNGDMRANGNFDFRNGSPTVNGSVFAALNEKLVPLSAGKLNSAPVKMSQSTYSGWSPPNTPKLGGESDSAYATRNAAYKAMLLARRRQGYNSATHGSAGTADFDRNIGMLFKTDGSVVNGDVAGAVIGDANGTRSWTRTSTSDSANVTMLDTEPTKEVIMPDLNDVTHYTSLSTTYVDAKQNFADGTANPNYGQGAYVDVWNSTTSSYTRLTTSGVVTGSAVLIGTADHPIKIHGPVTVTQDIAIKGYVSGQGTLYTGRNIHVVGSVRYTNSPTFTAGPTTAADNANEKQDMLGLAARGSVVMGDPTSFSGHYPLDYMTPINPPSKTVGTYGRYDEAGNWIPPYDANEVDSTGRKRYQSVIADSTIHSIAEGVNQVDAIMYSNFVGGGNIGTSGGGVVFNGSIVCRDEALVTYSLPIVMNYDNRIRERELTQAPLIDINLPRSPVLLRSTWQDRGFVYRR